MVKLALGLMAAAGLLASMLSGAQAATDPCQSLFAAMGVDKVTRRGSVEATFNPLYSVSTTEYYNQNQRKNVPSCVVYPTSAQDVSVAIKAIRAADAKFAVKARGHATNMGFSSVKDGVLIDLQKMTQRTYDPKTQLASFGPGGRWADIYGWIQSQGRMVLGGRLPGIGVGLALGGGLSHLSPQHGMVCDQFVELEVVTADGNIVVANNQQNSDLLWALRGGGNQFGVVTRFTVNTYPTGKTWAGNIVYGGDQAENAMMAAHDFAKYNTDPKAAIIGTVTFAPSPDLFNLHLDEIFILFAVYDGTDPGNAYANFTKIPHVLDTTQVRPTYLDAITMLPGADMGPGAMYYRVNAQQANDANDATVRKQFANARDFAAKQKGKYTLFSMDYQVVGRTLLAASAKRGGNVLGLESLQDTPQYWINYAMGLDANMPAAQMAEVESAFKASSDAVPSDPELPLFLNDAGADQHSFATYSTFDRLKSVKQKYDPTSFFSRNTQGPSFEPRGGAAKRDSLGADERPPLAKARSRRAHLVEH